MIATRPPSTIIAGYVRSGLGQPSAVPAIQLGSDAARPRRVRPRNRLRVTVDSVHLAPHVALPDRPDRARWRPPPQGRAEVSIPRSFQGPLSN
jgi:hypothetical protein